MTDEQGKQILCVSNLICQLSVCGNLVTSDGSREGVMWQYCNTIFKDTQWLLLTQELYHC